jgi:hypothetical protein
MDLSGTSASPKYHPDLTGNREKLYRVIEQSGATCLGDSSSSKSLRNPKEPWSLNRIIAAPQPDGTQGPSAIS